MFGLDTVSSLSNLITKGIDKFVPDKMSESDKITLKQNMEKYIIEEKNNVEKMFIEDKKNARNLLIETEKATGKRNIHIYIIAYMMILSFFSLIGGLMFITIPPASQQTVVLLFGTLSTAFGAVISFFFGSSKSSQDKNELLKEKNKNS